MSRTTLVGTISECPSFAGVVGRYQVDVGLSEPAGQGLSLSIVLWRMTNWCHTHLGPPEDRWRCSVAQFHFAQYEDAFAFKLRFSGAPVSA